MAGRRLGVNAEWKDLGAPQDDRQHMGSGQHNPIFLLATGPVLQSLEGHVKGQGQPGVRGTGGGESRPKEAQRLTILMEQDEARSHPAPTPYPSPHLLPTQQGQDFCPPGPPSPSAPLPQGLCLYGSGFLRPPQSSPPSSLPVTNVRFLCAH